MREPVPVNSGCGCFTRRAFLIHSYSLASKSSNPTAANRNTIRFAWICGSLRSFALKFPALSLSLGLRTAARFRAHCPQKPQNITETKKAATSASNAPGGGHRILTLTGIQPSSVPDGTDLGAGTRDGGLPSRDRE